MKLNYVYVLYNAQMNNFILLKSNFLIFFGYYTITDPDIDLFHFSYKFAYFTRTIQRLSAFRKYILDIFWRLFLLHLDL